MIGNFTPCAVKNISVTDSAQTVEIRNTNSLTIDVMLINRGDAECFILFGQSGMDDVETTTGVAILPGVMAVFDFSLFTHVSVVCASSDSTSLQVVSGKGM